MMKECVICICIVRAGSTGINEKRKIIPVQSRKQAEKEDKRKKRKGVWSSRRNERAGEREKEKKKTLVASFLTTNISAASVSLYDVTLMLPLHPSVRPFINNERPPRYPRLFFPSLANVSSSAAGGVRKLRTRGGGRSNGSFIRALRCCSKAHHPLFPPQHVFIIPSPSWGFLFLLQGEEPPLRLSFSRSRVGFCIPAPAVAYSKQKKQLE